MEKKIVSRERLYATHITNFSLIIKYNYEMIILNYDLKNISLLKSVFLV